VPGFCGCNKKIRKTRGKACQAVVILITDIQQRYSIQQLNSSFSIEPRQIQLRASSQLRQENKTRDLIVKGDKLDPGIGKGIIFACLEKHLCKRWQ
jgi:hypothetical protein